MEAVRAYTAVFDPAAADRLAERLYKAADSLEQFPNRGRLGRDGLLELPTIRPYIIEYRVADEVVVILRIRHGRQRPPGD